MSVLGRFVKPFTKNKVVTSVVSRSLFNPTDRRLLQDIFAELEEQDLNIKRFMKRYEENNSWNLSHSVKLDTLVNRSSKVRTKQTKEEFVYAVLRAFEERNLLVHPESLSNDLVAIKDDLSVLTNRKKGLLGERSTEFRDNEEGVFLIDDGLELDYNISGIKSDMTELKEILTDLNEVEELKTRILSMSEKNGENATALLNQTMKETYATLIKENKGLKKRANLQLLFFLAVSILIGVLMVEGFQKKTTVLAKKSENRGNGSVVSLTNENLLVGEKQTTASSFFSKFAKVFQKNYWVGILGVVSVVVGRAVFPMLYALGIVL